MDKPRAKRTQLSPRVYYHVVLIPFIIATLLQLAHAQDAPIQQHAPVIINSYGSMCGEAQNGGQQNGDSTTSGSTDFADLEARVSDLETRVNDLVNAATGAVSQDVTGENSGCPNTEEETCDTIRGEYRFVSNVYSFLCKYSTYM